MASFAYVARTAEGRELTGSITGTSLEAAIGQLHSKGFIVLRVSEERREERSGAGFNRFIPLSMRQASTRDIALFTRQLATVLEAGIPLARALRGLATDFGNKTISRAIADVALRLERGESLADALANHPEAFNGMYVSMVQAGERAGTLGEILEELAVYLEKADAMRSKIRAALSYPIFVLFFSLIGTAVLVFQVAPTMSKMYADLGQKLPALTQTVLSVSNGAKDHIFLTLGILLAVTVGIWMGIRTKGGRYFLDNLSLNLPVFGPISRKIVMSRFARTFGILFRSGLPLLDGLDLVKGATGNSVISQAIEEAKEKITGGAGITSAFRSTGKFPEMILQLMSTGEESGQLDAMLLKTSEFYDRQVDSSMQSLTSLIEPVMMVVVGSLVGTVVISMFLPIFSLGDAVMKGGFNY